MFFSTYSNNFKNPKMGQYCDLKLARDIQETFDMPPCPYTGLKEAGWLRMYYYQLVSMCRSASPDRRMHRQLALMTDWALRLYIKTAKYNWPIKQKMRLLYNPKLRARVLAELGGERALQRWERLKARAAQFVAPDAESEPGSPQSTAEIPDEVAPLQEYNEGEHDQKDRAHRARADSRGEFRLAPIPSEQKNQAVRSASRMWRLIRYTSRPPVPLTPDELRGPRPRRNLAAFKARYDYDTLPLKLTYSGAPPKAPPDAENPV